MKLLIDRKLTVATAESCTGGLIAGMLTDVPGSSSVVLGGWVTYANAMKTAQLGVDAALLESHGAVSEPVVRAMAQGALARSGADIAGVVSFHGGLDSAGTEAGKDIKCNVLICHGADDPFVPQEGIDAMVAEFDANDVDWQMIEYSGAVHSFTQPMAGDDPSAGAAYHPNADARSWWHMQIFFAEVLDLVITPVRP